MQKIFIIESFGKIKEVSKILGSDFKVIATGGHIFELKTENMGIDEKMNPIYCPIYDKKKIIKKLKKLKNYDIYIGSDIDREGECIA